jgi:hypothetical protein
MFKIQDHFFCSITHEIMIDPVMAADGHSYERKAIEEWFRRGYRTSPMTNSFLPHSILTPNVNLKNAIDEFLEENSFLEKKSQDDYNDLLQAVALKEKFWADELEKEQLKSIENLIIK